MNVHEDLLQIGEQENENENYSSQEKKNVKKKVAKKVPAKINIKTEAQKKDTSTPTMLSKLWQQFISFQVIAIITAEGKTQGQKGLDDTALVLYQKKVKALVQKSGYYNNIDEFNVGEITEEQMYKTKGLTLIMTGKKIWNCEPQDFPISI